MNRRSVVTTLALAGLRVLALAHPARARQRYAAELRATLRAAIEDAGRRGTTRAILVAAAELSDIVRSGVAARRGVRITASAVPPSSPGGVPVIPTSVEWRHALRRLLARPAYSGVVIAALALGIGANAVVFTVADAVLFRGAPYPDAPRLVEIFHQPAVGNTFFPGLPVAAVEEWRQQRDLFERVEGFNLGSFVVTSGSEPETIPGTYVTAGLFPMLGVRPALGRLFDEGEEVPGRNRVVILSHQLWQRLFGGDPGVIGRELVLEGEAHTVVGVMPRGFRFPAGPQRLWLPQPPSVAGRAPRLQAVALLAPGVSADAAQERSEAVAAGLQEARPAPMGWKIRLMPLRGTMMNRTTAQAMRILLWAVALVLLIACANVANLFLSQALARGREMSVRAALGASRWRLVRELLAEGMLLALAGGAAAVAVAWWGVEAVAAIAPEPITRMNVREIRFDGRAIAFTGAVTLLTGLLFAVLPALRVSRSSLTPALAGRSSTQPPSHARFRSMLVVAEVALSVVLLLGAALLMRSFVRLQAVDIGYETRSLLQADVSLPADRYPEAVRAALFEDLQQHVRSMPGVTAVATGNALPASGGIQFGDIEIEGREVDGKSAIIPEAAVGPDYFATLGLPIVAGRAFSRDDGPDALIVSESLASQYWPDGGAIGARLRLSERGGWKTIVGVAGEVRQEHREPLFSRFELYTPLWPRTPEAPPAAAILRGDRTSVTVFVRAERPMALVPLIKQAVWRLAPGQPVEATLAEHSLGRAFAEERFALTLMAVFAGIALVLAVAGLYAVLSQMVLQRAREIGIRIALGARDTDVLRLVVARGIGLTGLGVLIGGAAMYPLATYIRSRLYETSPADPVSVAAVVATVGVVAGLACWLPTRAALSIDPIETLRAE